MSKTAKLPPWPQKTRSLSKNWRRRLSNSTPWTKITLASWCIFQLEKTRCHGTVHHPPTFKNRIVRKYSGESLQHHSQSKTKNRRWQGNFWWLVWKVYHSHLTIRNLAKIKRRYDYQAWITIQFAEWILIPQPTCIPFRG